MADPKPPINITIDGRMDFQMHRKGFSGSLPRLHIYNEEKEHALTIVLEGYCSTEKTFSIAIALKRGLLDLIYFDTDTRVSIPPSDKEPGTLTIPAGVRDLWFKDLKLDFLDSFLSQHLTPGCKYEIRWASSGGTEPWCYRGEQPKERIPVRCGKGSIKLSVLDDTATPPRISIALTPTAEVCHPSGEPKFAFLLEITSHIPYVITVCINKTPFREYHGMEELFKVSEETGEEVDWPWGIGCFTGYDYEPFPGEDEFLELYPGVSWRTEWSLDKYESGRWGELDVLKAGRSYRAEVCDDLFTAFGQWMEGAKNELLVGTEKEKRERWNFSRPSMLFETSEPFTFKAV